MNETPNATNQKSPMSRSRAVALAIVSFLVLIGLAILVWNIANGLLPKKFFDTSPSVQSSVQGTTSETYLVTKVVDGDTLKIQTDTKQESVRLLGIDTPETQDPRKPVQCFGKEAKTQLQNLVEGKRVRLEADTTQGDRDAFGRLLRYVYLEDNTNVNSELVKQGFAFVYRQYPVKQLQALITLETQARAEKRGLWSGCDIQEKNGREQTAPVQ